jgi:hypothetical protein
MKIVSVLAWALMPVLFAANAANKDSFDLSVTRVRIPRNQSGDLHIDVAGIRFRSSDGKTTVAIAMQDLREADVADSHALRFETYEINKWKLVGRRVSTFRARGDAPIEELAQFFAAHVLRPVVGH